MDTGHGPEPQEEYSFMQETFKDERLSLKKVVLKVLKWAGLGLTFGATACITFFALRPWAEDKFQPEPDQVEIHSQEVEEQEQTSQEEETQETVKEQLTIDDYYILNSELKQVANTAQKCVVTVSGLKGDADWTSGETIGSSAGLIAADNGRELLILSSYENMKSAQFYQVEFSDGSQHQAALKQKDSNMDMAVFSVAKDGITETTSDQISIAEFGNSNRLGQGRTLIAVGQPFGFPSGIGYGVVSSLKEQVINANGEFDVIVTDMVLSERGSGFLFDIYGNVMGYIDVKLANKLGAETMVAYSISDVTDVIELMSNGKSVPYAGIVGMMVTEEAAELHDIPKGFYVVEVETDSPAMQAGIQSGDIITEIRNTEITSMDGYHNALFELTPGMTAKFKGQRYGTEEYIGIDFAVTIGIKE